MTQRFLLEVWEKKEVVTESANFAEAVAKYDVSDKWSFESIRVEGQPFEDRLTSYDTCCLCSKPMLGDKMGPVDQGTLVKDPLFGGTASAHAHCAAEKGEEADPCNEMWQMVWTAEQIQQGIQKNLSAAVSTCADLITAVQDNDLAESKKMLSWLDSQTRGLRQMLGAAEARKFSLSA